MGTLVPPGEPRLSLNGSGSKKRLLYREAISVSLLTSTHLHGGKNPEHSQRPWACDPALARSSAVTASSCPSGPTFPGENEGSG